jgi:hypothetical protein
MDGQVEHAARLRRLVLLDSFQVIVRRGSSTTLAFLLGRGHGDIRDGIGSSCILLSHLMPHLLAKELEDQIQVQYTGIVVRQEENG